MKLKNLYTDDDAVSPVIGVILMVAITVILAAVIASFVLGLGNQVSQTAPRASFSTDFTDENGSEADTLEFTHDGGDSIKAGHITVSASGVEGNDSDGSAYTSNVEIVEQNKWSDLTSASSESDVAAGDTLTLSGDDFEYNGDALDGTADKGPDGNTDYVEFEGATIRLVWSSDSGDSSATLSKWEGPDA